MPRRDRLLIEENWFSFSASSTTLLRLIERQSSLLSSSSCIRFATRLLIIVNTGMLVSLSDRQSGKGFKCSRRTSSQRWFGVTVESVWSNRLIRWSEGHSYEKRGEGEEISGLNEPMTIEIVFASNGTIHSFEVSWLDLFVCSVEPACWIRSVPISNVWRGLLLSFLICSTT